MSDLEKLFNLESEKVNPKLLSAMVAQYDSYAMSLTSSRNTRGLFHTIFISIHSIIFAVIGLSVGNGEALIHVSSLLIMNANIIGIVMSVLWLVIIMKFRLEAKHCLILLCEAERFLPFNFFTEEYKMKESTCILIRSIYKYAEPSIPYIFAIIHIVIASCNWYLSLV